MGSAWGVRIDGAAKASDISSMVTFLGGPLFNNNFAPFSEVIGEYNTHICPLDKPITIYVKSAY
jgi:hypothetical protein